MSVPVRPGGKAAPATDSGFYGLPAGSAAGRATGDLTRVQTIAALIPGVIQDGKPIRFVQSSRLHRENGILRRSGMSWLS